MRMRNPELPLEQLRTLVQDALFESWSHNSNIQQGL